LDLSGQKKIRSLNALFKQTWRIPA
jgi:hypothetical protein